MCSTWKRQKKIIRGKINFFNFTALHENKRPCSIQTRLVDRSNAHCATEINTKLNVGDNKLINCFTMHWNRLKFLWRIVINVEVIGCRGSLKLCTHIVHKNFISAKIQNNFTSIKILVVKNILGLNSF